MEDPGQQPDFQLSIQSFLSFLDRSSYFEVIEPESLDGPIRTGFTVRDRVREYLEGNDQEKLKQIIADLFPRGDGIWPNDILPNNISVFCTLLKISKGRWIKHFRHHESLSDAKLPFDPKSHPPNWPEDTEDPDFLKKFCEEQWKYCVPVFRQPFVDKHFPKQTILPIVYKKSLSSGGSATLWLIRLHPAYNKLLSDAEKVRLRNSADTFVLKTYITAAAATTYAREVEAFRRLQQQGGETGIIGFHGSFTRGDEHHVLLEYADKGTLEEYFKKETPPVDPEEIINFWEALFKILDALNRIHRTYTDGAGGTHIGWHQDVKPENILVVSNGSTNSNEWQFKLADLGTSHFKRVDASRQDSTASDSYGTRTYGAPECYRPDETSVRDKLRVGQNVDIWSLGCVYSEAARWVKGHYRGVVQYRNERKDEISKIAEFQDADCFHDGGKVLIAVKESHRKSTTNLRTEDYITKVVVDRMITDMLEVAPARPTATNLWYKSIGIVKEARNQLQLATSPSGERRTSRAGLSRSRTVPEHTPPSPPVLPPHFSAPDSPDFDRLHQRDSSTPRRPERLSTHSRISSSHLLESPSPNGRGEQHGHSPDSIAEDSQWTAHSPGSSAQQRSVDIPRFAARGDASARETTKRSSQHSVSTTPQAGMSGMGTAWESGSMSTMNGGYQRGARKRYSGNSESYPLSPILGQTGANRRSNSPDEIDQRESPPKNHRYNSQGESSHSRVVSDDSVLSTMTSTGVHHSTTENLTTHPHSQHRPPPALTQHTEHNSTPPATLPPERWSVDEALDWKRKRKGKIGRHTAIPNPQLHDRLRKRDHVFLIDDSASMKPHWEWLIRVVEALTYILKEVDPNGLDLSFTICRETLTKTKRTTSLVELVESRSKLLKGTTDMNLRLSEILDTYQTELEKPKTFWRKSVLPMNLYILTDGIWEPNCDAAGPITNLVNKLNKLHKGRVQVGIQFISFGNNAEAINRLNILDSGLGLRPDIVDHEPSNRDVWKMLLGSTNDYYDSQNERPQATPTTSNEKQLNDGS